MLTKPITTAPLISVIAPFFNEGKGVDAFYSKVCSATKSIDGARFEFICVDDGSTDDTLQRLAALPALDPRFRIIELSRNFGKESALTAGIDAAQGDAVIPIDADLQDPPELIAVMIEKWHDGADVVIARRSRRDNDSFAKRRSAELFYRLHNRLSNIDIPENVGDFRLMDRAVVQALGRIGETQRFMKGLFAWLGFRTVTIDYTRPPRVEGKTKFSGWKLWNLALEGITSFSTAPLRVWTYIGGVGALATFFYAAFIVLRTLVHGVDVPGYASLLVVVLFLGSLQLISIGLLGEYIGRMYLESKRRPIYLIRKIYERPDES
jgi:glycosyltransferase involved in cell wall biosynthesis